MLRSIVIMITACLFLAGCNSIGAETVRLTDRLAAFGFISTQKQYGAFRLREAIRQGRDNHPVWIVYSGDGRAWLDRWTPSPDPTPSVDDMPSLHVATSLAQYFPQDTIIHLTRPCQFLDSPQPQCTPHYWTRNRFGAEVRHAYSVQTTAFHNYPVIFVGWSGGGIIAAHMAHQRSTTNGQTGLLTLAAPLDLDRWTQWHKVTALPATDNPARFLPLTIPHAHGVGENDQIVPWEAVNHLKGQALVAGITHHGAWQEFAIKTAPSLRDKVILARP